MGQLILNKNFYENKRNMKNKIIYETKWLAKDNTKEYPHGWGFTPPFVEFDQNLDPSECNKKCKELSNNEFICYGATPRELIYHPIQP